MTCKVALSRLVQKYKNRTKEMNNTHKKEIAAFPKNYSTNKSVLMRSNSKLSMGKSDSGNILN